MTVRPTLMELVEKRAEELRRLNEALLAEVDQWERETDDRRDAGTGDG